MLRGILGTLRGPLRGTLWGTLRRMLRQTLAVPPRLAPHTAASLLGAPQAPQHPLHLRGAFRPWRRRGRDPLSAALPPRPGPSRPRLHGGGAGAALRFRPPPDVTAGAAPHRGGSLPGCWPPLPPSSSSSSSSSFALPPPPPCPAARASSTRGPSSVRGVMGWGVLPTQP